MALVTIEWATTTRPIADLTEAIRLDPKAADAYYTGASPMSTKGDTDKAIADFTEAIRLDPKRRQSL